MGRVGYLRGSGPFTPLIFGSLHLTLKIVMV